MFALTTKPGNSASRVFYYLKIILMLVGDYEKIDTLYIMEFMNKHLRRILIQIAEEEIKGNDSSHDFLHAKRVLENAELIQSKEGGDLDILIPAALFHDVVIYPKNQSVLRVLLLKMSLPHPILL